MTLEKLSALAGLLVVASGIGAWGANIIYGGQELEDRITKNEDSLSRLDSQIPSKFPTMEDITILVRQELEDKQNKLRDWTTPNLDNGWRNYDNGFERLSYNVNRNGIVSLRGVITANGPGDQYYKPVIILPVVFRPKRAEIFSVISAGGVGRVDVLADGQVVPKNGSNEYISLSGITFQAKTK